MNISIINYDFFMLQVSSANDTFITIPSSRKLKPNALIKNIYTKINFKTLNPATAIMNSGKVTS